MSWRDTPLALKLGMRLPIIQAPMAGGLSTSRLTAAVCEAGGLGSIAGAMLAPDDLRAAIREVRALTSQPFAVNLFAPLPAPTRDRVAEWSGLTGVEATARSPTPRFADQVTVLDEETVPILSFTFGIPQLADAKAFKIGTATTVAEAVALEHAGVDAIVVQGYEAGGHRGTFLETVEHSPRIRALMQAHHGGDERSSGDAEREQARAEQDAVVGAEAARICHRVP